MKAVSPSSIVSSASLYQYLSVPKQLASFIWSRNIRWQDPLVFIVLTTQHMDHFWSVHLCSVIDPWMCVDLYRSCKLWSFSTYPFPDFLFSHVLDVMELLSMKPCPTPVPCSLSSNTLSDLCQPPLEPYFRGAALLLTDTPRCGSIAFHSSFLPLSFSLHFSLSFCPKIPRFWEFRIYTHCSVSLSHTSFTKSSWEDPLFFHSVGDPLFSHHGSGHSQPHW